MNPAGGGDGDKGAGGCQELCEDLLGWNTAYQRLTCACKLGQNLHEMGIASDFGQVWNTQVAKLQAPVHTGLDQPLPELQIGIGVGSVVHEHCDCL